MKNITLLLVFMLIATTLNAQSKDLHVEIVLSKEYKELIIAWDASTNQSKIFHFKNKKYTPLNTQLPQYPLGQKAKRMHISAFDTSEGVKLLVWDIEKGISIIFLLSQDKITTIKGKIPQQPLGNSKNIMMKGYTNNYGEELLWIWNTKTNNAHIFYYNTNTKVYELLDESLPQNPFVNPKK